MWAGGGLGSRLCTSSSWGGLSPQHSHTKTRGQTHGVPGRQRLTPGARLRRGRGARVLPSTSRASSSWGLLSMQRGPSRGCPPQSPAEAPSAAGPGGHPSAGLRRSHWQGPASPSGLALFALLFGGTRFNALPAALPPGLAPAFAHGLASRMFFLPSCCLQSSGRVSNEAAPP